MTSTATIDQLRPGQEYPDGNINARLHYTDAEIEELGASLKGPDGQLRPFLVATHPKKPKLFFVFGGGRRRIAIERLIGRGELPSDHPIEIKDHGHITVAEALSKSYADNQSVPMHPADLAATFAKLAADKSPEDIARDRGMTLKAVQQSIALGTTLVPEVLDQWRTGKLSRENVEILTTATPELQTETMKRIAEHDFDPSRVFEWEELKKRIASNKGPEMTRLLGFVGLDEHRAGGGEVVQDFFGQGGVVKDIKLLNKHANAKMKTIVQAELDSGWSWCEGKISEHRRMHHGYGETKAKPDYTADEKKRVSAIEARCNVLDEAEWYETSASDEQERLLAERDQIEIAATARAFTAKQKAGAGVLVYLNRDGSPHYIRGLIRKAEPKKKGKAAPAQSQPRQEDPLSWNAKRALSDWQDAAMGDCLMEHPKEAAAAFLAACGIERNNDSAPIRPDMADHAVKVAKANGFEHAFAELRKNSPEKMMQLLGTVAAHCVAITDYRNGRKKSAGVLVALVGEKNFAAALEKQFDAKMYFTGASKQHIMGVYKEAFGEAARKNCEDKGVEALRAEAIKTVPASGWLPPELRTSLYAKPSPSATVTKLPAKKPAKSAAPKKKAA